MLNPFVQPSPLSSLRLLALPSLLLADKNLTSRSSFMLKRLEEACANGWGSRTATVGINTPSSTSSGLRSEDCPTCSTRPLPRARSGRENLRKNGEIRATQGHRLRLASLRSVGFAMAGSCPWHGRNLHNLWLLKASRRLREHKTSQNSGFNRAWRMSLHELRDDLVCKLCLTQVISELHQLRSAVQ